MQKGPQNIYVVRWRDRHSKPQVTLVLANTHGYALQDVERSAPGEVVQKPSVEELWLGDSTDYDAAYTIWTGGNRPGEDSA